MTESTDYDLILESYDKSSEEMEQQARTHFRTVLPTLKGKGLLDIGCGSGVDAEFYASQGAKVKGIDISTESISKANAKGIGRFLQGDMHSLPYADGSFDVTVSWYALQAGRDLPLALREAFRVTRPGGIVAFLSKHPIRSMVEGMHNDGMRSYFSDETITSRILDRTIELREPHHTLPEYLTPATQGLGTLEHMAEGFDFPASERVLGSFDYPTYLIMRWHK